MSKGGVKVCHPYGVNLALVRHAFIERLVEKLDFGCYPWFFATLHCARVYLDISLKLYSAI